MRYEAVDVVIERLRGSPLAVVCDAAVLTRGGRTADVWLCCA